MGSGDARQRWADGVIRCKNESRRRNSFVRGNQVEARVQPKNARAPVISVDEALARIVANVRRLPPREVALLDAVDRFAARDVSAGLSLPPFDNSSVDGYAVMAASCAIGTRLKVVGEQAAGPDRSLSIQPGEALRILTGAPLPAGADAVIMQEETEREGNEVLLKAEVRPGEFVRQRGGDVTEGQKLLAAGERVRTQTVALLAAQGMSSLQVGGEVQATVVSTGDELVAPGSPLRAGQIYESNSILLQTMLTNCGVDVVSVTHCQDRAEEIEAALRAGARCDVMVITGGVSVGAHDLVKPALAKIGATLDLWKVAVKPGKPFLFGRANECAVFGLPGNPISAFVTFLLFVRPAIFKLMGADDAELRLPESTARLRVAVHNDAARPHYVRGSLRHGSFTPVGLQESHALFGLSRSNALLLAPSGAEIAAGELVTVSTWE